MDAYIIGEQNTGSCYENEGDVNEDGYLNILDIVIIANIIMGVSEDIPQADLNLDEEINILDIVILANIILAN